MSRSIHTTAQVTHVDEADMTELVALRDALKGEGEKRGVKLTFLPLIIKAIIPALKEFPYTNASLDEQANEIVLKRSYNVGIRDRHGERLVVPVVKDADKKDVFQIALDIQQLAAKARSGGLTLEDVHGSTFTVTNQGSVRGLFRDSDNQLSRVGDTGDAQDIEEGGREGGRNRGEGRYVPVAELRPQNPGRRLCRRFVNRIISVIRDPALLRAGCWSRPLSFGPGLGAAEPTYLVIGSDIFRISG